MSRIGLFIVLLVSVMPAGAATAPGIPLERCGLLGGVEALCGRLDVPEDRAHPGGRSISLRIAVIPARAQPSEPDPLVYITGGPGGSAVDAAIGALAIFRGLNAHRDIVLVDQRGTGGSNNLVCPMPRDVARISTDAGVKDYVRRCLAALDADPTQYTTEPAMEDLAAVVRALGYERVNVFGASYGGTAAQYFLAQHPELVRTAILDGATLLDIPIFERLAPNGERALRAILGRCAQSGRCGAAYPRVRSEVFEVIAGLRQRLVRVGDTRIDVATAADVFKSLTLTPGGAAEIPWIAHRARIGDWKPLLLALDREGVPSLGNRQVMYMSIVCNEPWARWRPDRVARAAAGTYLREAATMTARRVAAGCSVVPKTAQPGWSRVRVRSTAPVMFVVGGNDPQDPLSHVASARRELPNSRIVVVPSAGHTAAHLGCLPRLVQAFVERGGAAGLDVRCAGRYAPPPFVIG